MENYFYGLLDKEKLSGLINLENLVEQVKSVNTDSVNYLKSHYDKWITDKTNPDIEMIAIEKPETSLTSFHKVRSSAHANANANAKGTFLFDNIFTSKIARNQLIDNFLVKGSYLANLTHQAWLDQENYQDDTSNDLVSKLRNKHQPIRIGVYGHFKPVCFLNSENQLDGFEVRLLETIFEPLLSCFGEPDAKKIPREKIYQFISLENYHDLWSLPENIDIAAGGLADSFQRQREGIYWTIPHFTVKRSMVYLKSDSYLTKLKRQIYGEMNANDTLSESTLMTKLPPNSRIIATYGSTGWEDATQRLQSRSDITLLRGTTDQEDLTKLSTGQVTGLMRGDHVCRALVHENPEILDYMYPWDIVPGITPERLFQGHWLPTETFCFSTHNLQLKQFIDLRVMELTLNGYLLELAKIYGLTDS